MSLARQLGPARCLWAPLQQLLFAGGKKDVKQMLMVRQREARVGWLHCGASLLGVGGLLLLDR